MLLALAGIFWVCRCEKSSKTCIIHFELISFLNELNKLIFFIVYISRGFIDSSCNMLPSFFVSCRELISAFEMLAEILVLNVNN